MAEKRNRQPRNEERPELLEDDERGLGQEDDEFEDVESEDEDLDEDIVDEESSGQERGFTAEIGSEGGSAGNTEVRRARSGAVRGSEATEIGKPSPNFSQAVNRRH